MSTRTASSIQSGNNIEIFLLPSDSSERFLIDLIEEFGSVELGIGVSTHPASKNLIETLRSVTNGFLVLNAVYLENQIFRLPNHSEREELEKSWKMPLNWLSPAPMNSDKNLFRTLNIASYPVNTLEETLTAHSIKAFLVAEGHQSLMRGKLKSNSKSLSVALVGGISSPDLVPF